MKQQTTNPTGKGPTVKKTKKTKTKSDDQPAQKAEIAPMEQARPFEGVGMDQNHMQKPANVATRSQKPAVDSKAKAKVNSKPTKNTKENSECHFPALKARDVKEVA